MVEILSALVVGGVLLPVGGEIAARAAVRHRVASLVAGVVEARAPVHVVLPPSTLLPELSRGQLGRADVSCARVGLPGIEVVDVQMELHGMAVDRRLVVRRGEGSLRGRIPAEEVLSAAGVPGTLELTEGQLTVRWPAPRRGRPSIGVRLRPVLAGNRIRLAPSPVSLSLPTLPPGVTISGVEARDDALEVHASLDLPTLLNP